MIKKVLPCAGDRIELVSMDNDPNPIEPGTRGTVLGHNSFQIHVKWDNGRTLSLAVPEDRFNILPKESSDERQASP